MPAPVALFVYNRLRLAQQTAEALRANELAPQTDLYVFSDGPKSFDETAHVDSVRRYFSKLAGFRSVNITMRPTNLGLSESITAGVTELCARFGRVIVVEDDLVTSRHFLGYMNGALDLYQDTLEVISIHGYVYPHSARLGETFFLRGADCWGWATWQRGWNLFNSDAAALLRALEEEGLQKDFDFKHYPYTDMLRQQASGRNDSWAIRWYASAFLLGKLTLYPGRSLVQNIGTDGTHGTHSGWTSGLQHQSVASANVHLTRIPTNENPVARQEFERFFRLLRWRRSVLRVWKSIRRPGWAVQNIGGRIKSSAIGRPR